MQGELDADRQDQEAHDPGERADPGLYAEMVAADRNLRLRGYEVFRFGGSEFSHPKGSMQESVDELVKSFFEELFVVHRVG